MNNENKEALQQLLQGANVNIHQLVVGDSTQTIENLIMWKSHTNLTHPGKYFRPSKVKIMRPTSPK